MQTELARLHSPAAAQAAPMAAAGTNGTSTNGPAKTRHEWQGRGPGPAGVETATCPAGPQLGSAAYATDSQIALLQKLARRERVELGRICED